MADEWYGDILQKGDYNFDYNKICDSFLEIINNFKYNWSPLVRHATRTLWYIF